MASYSDGTIQITGGSKTIVGSGTKFLSRVAVGQYLAIWGLAGVFKIAGVTDDVTLQMNINLPGSQIVRNLSYVVCDHFTPFLSLPLMQPGSINTNQQMQRVLRILDLELPTTALTYD